jgi:hypothetical protein
VDEIAEEIMFSTWDRYPAAAGRWLRETAHGRRHADPMDDFISSVDWMMYVAAGGLAACVMAIVFT